jgi:sphingomyelin phosphodiesterase
MLLATRVLLPLVIFCTYVAGSLVNDIVDALQSAVNCAGCHALLVPLKGLAVLGDSAFTNTLVTVCKALDVSLPIPRRDMHLDPCMS